MDMSDDSSLSSDEMIDVPSPNEKKSEKSKRIDVLYNLAQNSVKNGDYADCIRRLEEAINLEPYGATKKKISRLMGFAKDNAPTEITSFNSYQSCPTVLFSDIDSPAAEYERSVSVLHQQQTRMTIKDNESSSSCEVKLFQSSSNAVFQTSNTFKIKRSKSMNYALGNKKSSSPSESFLRSSFDYSHKSNSGLVKRKRCDSHADDRRLNSRKIVQTLEADTSFELLSPKNNLDTSMDLTSPDNHTQMVPMVCSTWDGLNQPQICKSPKIPKSRTFEFDQFARGSGTPSKFGPTGTPKLQQCKKFTFNKSEIENDANAANIRSSIVEKSMSMPVYKSKFQTPSREQLHHTKVDVSKPIKNCVASGIRMLALDFDKTLVKCHVNGPDISIIDMHDFVRPVFKILVPEAIANNMVISIVTFSPFVELIRNLVQKVFKDVLIIDHNCFICGAMSHMTTIDSNPSGKKEHIVRVCQNYERVSGLCLSPDQILLIDDDVQNIQLARGCGIKAIMFHAKEREMQSEDKLLYDIGHSNW